MWGVGREERGGVAVCGDHQMLCTGREGCVFVFVFMCLCVGLYTPLMGIRGNFGLGI